MSGHAISERPESGQAKHQQPEAAEPAPTQRYRFRVCTADGRQLVSQVAEVRLQRRLQALQWSKPRMGAGETVTLRASAPGRDGQEVVLTVERRQERGGWEALGSAIGRVASGGLAVDFRMPRVEAPAARASAAPPLLEVRFRARAEDGHEVHSASALLESTPGAAPAALSAAHWGHLRYQIGDEASLSVHALGLEGAQVHLVIEREQGAGWSPVAEQRAKVEDGLARLWWRIPALPLPPKGPGGEVRPARLRFHALAGFASALSEPIEAAPVVGNLANPRWAQAHPSLGARFAHGDTAGMRVEAAGLDGRPVRFVVEEQHGGDWTPYQVVTAEVRGGVAVASVPAHHPSVPGRAGSKAGAAPVTPSSLRFRAELA